MKLFLFLGSRRGYAVLKKLMTTKANICGILCLIEDAHEEQYHTKITEIAKEQNIPIYYSSDIKPSDYPTVLKETQPDIAFAIGWRYIISKLAYDIPPKGTLILHDSLLPAYRGFAPMNWAIINGEAKTGVTLFYIAEGIDCGPIVDQMETDILISDTAKTVDAKVIKLYEEIITRNLSALASGIAKKITQDESAATYTCKRTPGDGEINWHLSARQVYNLIRGLSHPFPGAYTTLKGLKVYIWEAVLPTDSPRYVGCVPGRILGKKNGMIEVLTGDGVIALKRLQYSEESEKDASDITISVKDTFGR